MFDEDSRASFRSFDAARVFRKFLARHGSHRRQWNTGRPPQSGHFRGGRSERCSRLFAARHARQFVSKPPALFDGSRGKASGGLCSPHAVHRSIPSRQQVFFLSSGSTPSHRLNSWVCKGYGGFQKGDPGKRYPPPGSDGNGVLECRRVSHLERVPCEWTDMSAGFCSRVFQRETGSIRVRCSVVVLPNLLVTLRPMVLSNAVETVRGKNTRGAMLRKAFTRARGREITSLSATHL